MPKKSWPVYFGEKIQLTRQRNIGIGARFIFPAGTVHLIGKVSTSVRSTMSFLFGTVRDFLSNPCRFPASVHLFYVLRIPVPLVMQGMSRRLAE